MIVISGLSKSFDYPGFGRLGGSPSEIADMSWFYHDFLSTTITTFSDYSQRKPLSGDA